MKLFGKELKKRNHARIAAKIVLNYLADHYMGCDRNQNQRPLSIPNTRFLFAGRPFW